MIIGINGYAKSGKDSFAHIMQNLAQGFTAEEIIGHLEENDNYVMNPYGTDHWEVKKWAGKLKRIASILTGIPEYEFEKQSFKDSFMPKEWDYYRIMVKWGTTAIIFSKDRFESEEEAEKFMEDCGHSGLYVEKKQMTGREFLQDLGTDACRVGLHPNTWVNALLSEYQPLNPELRASMGNVLDYSACTFPNWMITDTRFPNEARPIKARNGIVIRINRKGIKPANAHPSETALDNWPFDYILQNDGSLGDFVREVDLFYSLMKANEFINKAPVALAKK